MLSGIKTATEAQLTLRCLNLWLSLRLSMKVGDLVRKKRDYARDHAFQRMPVGYIVEINGMDPTNFPSAHIVYKIKWFKTGHRTWMTWFKKDDLIKITKPLKKYQQMDVLT
jgi:hypothetical protein